MSWPAVLLLATGFLIEPQAGLAAEATVLIGFDFDDRGDYQLPPDGIAAASVSGRDDVEEEGYRATATASGTAQAGGGPSVSLTGQVSLARNNHPLADSSNFYTLFASAQATELAAWTVQGPWPEGTRVLIPVHVSLSGSGQSSNLPVISSEGPVNYFGVSGSAFGGQIGLVINAFETQTSGETTVTSSIGEQLLVELSVAAFFQVDVSVSGENDSANGIGRANGAIGFSIGQLTRIMPDFHWVGPTSGALYHGPWSRADFWSDGVTPDGEAAAEVVFDVAEAVDYTVTVNHDVLINAMLVGNGHLTLDLEGHTLQLLDHPDAAGATSALRIGLAPLDDGHLILPRGTLIADRNVQVQAADSAAGSLTVGKAASLLMMADHGQLTVGAYEQQAGSERNTVRVVAEGDAAGRLETDHLLIGRSGALHAEAELRVGRLAGQANRHVWIRDRIELIDGGLLSAGAVLLNGNGQAPAVVDVSGLGSRLLVDSFDDSLTDNGELFLAMLSVGDVGHGELRVRDGATVATGQGVEVLVGHATGARGVVDVSGIGGVTPARMESQILVVGHHGHGSLNVRDGGFVATEQIGIVGDEAGSFGQARVSDSGSFWTLDGGILAIGRAGRGELLIEQFARVRTAGFVLGNTPTGQGLLTVRDSGTLLADAALIGGKGDGTLILENGGTLTMPGFQPSIIVGGEASGQGLIDVSGAGSQITAPEAKLEVGAVGDGVLRVKDQGSVQTLLLEVHPRGVVQLADGTLTAGGVVVDAGGQIRGTGTLEITEDLLQNFGTIAPGLSPGTLIIDGDLRMGPAAELVIEIGGLTEALQDHLIVTGDVALDGRLQMLFVDGFAPRAGDSFAFLDVAGATTGAFAAFEFANLLPGFAFETSFDGARFRLTALNDGRLASNPVPVPAAVWLFGPALALLGWQRRRPGRPAPCTHRRIAPVRSH